MVWSGSSDVAETNWKSKVEQIKLDTGVSMKIVSFLPEEQDLSKPVLLFLHGSFHGSWAWEEYFMPYFAYEGYPVVALNWRGTGGTFAGEGVKKVKIREHVEDLVSVLSKLPAIVERDDHAKPVIICHSFGGLAVMKYLELYPSKVKDLLGLIFMSVVPPSGIMSMTMRFLRRDLLHSWKITSGMAMKGCTKNDNLCREMFFGGLIEKVNGVKDDHGVSDEDLQRYKAYFSRDSAATIDLFDLGKQLPSAAADKMGKAFFADELPPCLVIGASNDFIVDREGVQETARFLGVNNPVMIDAPHDAMLVASWENAARAILDWLDVVKSTKP